MDYTKYNVEDFASNESFIDWVTQSDPEAVKFWDLYISEHPEIKGRVAQAKALVLKLRRIYELKVEEAQVDSLWDTIEKDIPAAKGGKRATTPRVLALLSVVVLLVLAATYAVTFLAVDDPSYNAYEMNNGDFMEQVNETSQSMIVVLPDNSKVFLESQSRIKYRAIRPADSTRDVWLQGDAFFEVSRDPYKPFIVHSNEVLTKVLGTSFWVRAARDSENVVVSVKTGKVTVYSAENNQTDEKREGVVLFPNQQVSYERKKKSFDKTLIESPEVLEEEAVVFDFTFDNTPVKDVFQTLEKAYGIEIIYNEEVMEKCFITAPFGSEPLFEKLKIICETIGATYEVIDARVIVTSSGCL